jgi:hypothetical protein
MTMPVKIISGGQTGVDQAALDVALSLGIECGGWCPPGRLCESGIIPGKYPLVETPYERSEKAPGIPRSLRTEWNVRDSDATLILKPCDAPHDIGTEWTIKCAEEYGKPILIIDPYRNNSPQQIIRWLKENHFKTLNIAGPSESNSPGIYQKVFALLYNLG